MIGAVPGRELTLTAFAMLAVVAGCGGGESSATTSTPDEAANGAGSPSTTATSPQSPPALEPPPCPAAAGNCAEASGQIVYVERIDPDGDGDAHFVLISDEGITGSGISVIDVRADLRPDPLLRPGDMLAASGPVYRGSYGQRQIQADAVSFERVRGADERLAP